MFREKQSSYKGKIADTWFLRRKEERKKGKKERDGVKEKERKGGREEKEIEGKVPSWRVCIA